MRLPTSIFWRLLPSSVTFGDSFPPRGEAFCGVRQSSASMGNGLASVHGLALSVTFGDSSSKGRAKGVTETFLASPFGRGGTPLGVTERARMLTIVQELPQSMPERVHPAALWPKANISRCRFP